MVGLERSTLPLIGKSDFGLGSSAAVLSFIVAFGLAKSFTNLAAGVGAERLGRRRLLILGWTAALPVPLLMAVAFVRDTAEHVRLEQATHHDGAETSPGLREVFPDASYRQPALRACSQA